MLQQLLQIAGVSTKEEFYKKYPTEESFFRAHPEAKQLLTKKSKQPSMMMATPQAMYGMGMAYGGRVLPRARYGMQPQGDPEPMNQDYPTYQAFKAAHDQWLASQQEQANNPTPPVEEMPAQQQQSESSVTYPVYDENGNIGSYVDANGYPVSVNPNASSTQAAPTAAATSFKLNDYKGVSIYDFLTAQGKAGDLKTRKKLAQTLGMSNYTGRPDQNAQMMEMIRQNPDILSTYDDEAAPKSNITRTVAQTKNQKAAPTTQQLASAKHVAATGKPNVNWNNVPLMPAVTVVSKRNYKTMPGVTVHSKTLNPLQREIKNNAAPTMIRRNVQTQQWEPVLVGSGPSAENAQRIKLAQQKNAEEAGNILGLPQFRQQKMGGEPCYNCGGMYEHGGYYGNVPQHGRPGVYADGYSGTSNAGQYFAFGGLLGDISNGMRDGSLQGLAGSILPMANIYQDKLTGSPITSKITKLDANGQPIKDNSGLKDELDKYLSNLTGDIKKEDLQSIVSKYALGGMASQGYVPEYGTQAYGGQPLPQYGMGNSFQDGGSPLYSTQGQVLRNYTNTLAYPPGGWNPSHVTLPRVGFDSVMPSYGFFPEGGEVSPEDQAAMDMQQTQQAPPQEGGAPEQGGGQMDPQQIIQAVSQMLQQGMQPQEIIQQLSQMGIPPDQAQQLIQAVMQQMQGGQAQGPQEEMAEGPQGQEAPMQEAMEGQAPPMGRWGGKFAYGGFNTTMDTTQPPYGVGNLSKFVGQTMAEPSLEAMHEAAMQRMQRQMQLENASRAGGYNDQVAQQYAQAASEAAALNANHRMQRQMELENMNRNQPYYNMDSNSGAIRKYPPRPISQSPRTWAEGGSIGEEMDVTPEQMEYLRKQGYKFDII